jgi:hypothetical protein
MTRAGELFGSFPDFYEVIIPLSENSRAAREKRFEL